MSAEAHWLSHNDRFLSATVKRVRLRLQAMISEQRAQSRGGWFNRDKGTDANLPAPPAQAEIEQQLAECSQEIAGLIGHEPPPALVLLAQRLGLSDFDCEVLALCAAVELDTRIASLCAQAQGDANKPFPTFALAFALFDDPDWSAMSPHSPLRHWRLVEISQPGAQALAGASLVADERIVNYLKGLNYLDDRITPLVDPVHSGATGKLAGLALPPSQEQLVDDIIATAAHANGSGRMPVIELLGRGTAAKRMIAERAATMLGQKLYLIDASALPAQGGDFETFTRLWMRESLLMPLSLYIDANNPEEQARSRIKRFLERNIGLAFLDREEATPDPGLRRVSMQVGKPTPEEQQRLWAELLRDSDGDQAQRLAEQFSFNHDDIGRLADAALEDDGGSGETRAAGTDPAQQLWRACRIEARTGMDKLAQRIDARATWEQLVLPPDQKSLLHQITHQVSCRNLVYEQWGFRERMNRGLGINALFAGESGTGKTMAAEVIANDLALDLYRIDLSAVVSKYIGETEKNLRRLFDAAEDSGAIVFFDEADALFGKRSEVKDSHDRYANIEINYLLQRMESYRGVAILATNMKSSLDDAFLRRLRFVVDFPFPGLAERTEIWQKIFPPDTPLDEEFDYRRLARLSLTGGNIHNVAINAAFRAARERSPVTMPMVLAAARDEFRKLERPAKDTDFVWQGKLEAVP